jgi:3-oxoacyl-ACP reductase-like protein
MLMQSTVPAPQAATAVPAATAVTAATAATAVLAASAQRQTHLVTCATTSCAAILLLHRWLLLRREAGGIEQRQKHVNVLMYGKGLS